MNFELSGGEWDNYGCRLGTAYQSRQTSAYWQSVQPCVLAMMLSFLPCAGTVSIGLKHLDCGTGVRFSKMLQNHAIGLLALVAEFGTGQATVIAQTQDIAELSVR